MDRKGVSFTLTMVVAGVILFVTAVSIITLGGGALQSLFGWVGQQQEQASQTADIRQACFDKAEEINSQYCERYVTSCTDSSPRARATTDRTETANDMGCNWAEDWAGASDELDFPDSWQVQTQNTVADCAEEGYVVDTKFCPAEKRLN